MVQHGGGFLGFLATIHRFVDDRLTVIVLTNMDHGDPGRIANRTAGFYLGEPSALEAEEPTLTERLKAQLAALAAGEAGAAVSAPEAFAASEPSAASAFYRSLGPLGSLRLIERTGEASRRTYRFLAAFESTRWIQSVVLAEGDAVEELALEPE
jgi:hypothetical protein